MFSEEEKKLVTSILCLSHNSFKFTFPLGSKDYELYIKGKKRHLKYNYRAESRVQN